MKGNGLRRLALRARATRGLRRMRREWPGALLARRTRTIRMCSFDARSKGQPQPLPPRKAYETRRPSLDVCNRRCPAPQPWVWRSRSRETVVARRAHVESRTVSAHWLRAGEISDCAAAAGPRYMRAVEAPTFSTGFPPLHRVRCSSWQRF